MILPAPALLPAPHVPAAHASAPRDGRASPRADNGYSNKTQGFAYSFSAGYADFSNQNVI
jgi:hypothetical protein